MTKSVIVKHNSLINASYRLGLVEQRLLLLAISEIRRQKIPMNENSTITITADDYVNAFGVVRQVAYQALKDGASGIYQREFGWVEHTDKGVKIVRSRWASKIAYIDKTACVELSFTKDVLSRVQELAERFTKYELEQVACLNSKHSVRLYEIVIAWKGKGQTNQIAIDDLRGRMGLLDDEYTALHNFKSRVLQKAIDEINEKTGVNISYEQHKKGRVIVGFTFKVKEKNKRKAIKSLTDKQINAFAPKLAQLGELGHLAKDGASYDDFAKQIAQELKDSDKLAFYEPYLHQLGFK